MSDIPPNTMEMGNCVEGADCKEFGIKELKESPMKTNICVSQKILERINKHGSKSDLYLLRQLDQKYYETLNLTFLDLMDKCITIEYRLVTGESCTGRKALVRAPPFQATVKEGDNIKEITPENWTKEMFHIFRKLSYPDVDIQTLKCKERENPFFCKISSQLAPYITTLRFNNVELGNKNPGKKFAAFLNEFTSLKNLDVHCCYGYSHWTRQSAMSPDQLKIGLTNLLLKPKIKLILTFRHKDILTQLATEENVSFELSFLLLSSEQMNELVDIVQEYGNLKNIYYEMTVNHQVLRNLTRLEAFKRICVHLDTQIKYLNLAFELCEGSQEFENGEQMNIRSCLILNQMSPYINDMTIFQEMEPVWDILPHDSEWPKLTKLGIRGYEHPLEMLKNCSKLRELALDVDLNSCIFSNIHQTDKENLLEYFGNLVSLTELKLSQKDGEKIVEGNELHEYLKMILPQLETIKY